MNEQWRIAHKEHPLANFRALEYHDEPNSDGQEWWFQAWLPDFIAEIIEAEIADLKLSLSEVLIALDGREPEGGIYVSQAAQRVADLKRQLVDFEKDALGSSLSWFEEAKKLAAGKVEAERQLEEAWLELAPIDGQESLAKAISNAISRRNLEALRLETQLDGREATYQASMAALAGEIASLRGSERSLKTQLEEMTQEGDGD